MWEDDIDRVNSLLIVNVSAADVSLWRDDIAQNANNRNCQQLTCRTQTQPSLPGYQFLWPLSSYILSVCSPPRGITREQRYPTPAQSIGSPLSWAQSPTITHGDCTAGWAFDVQQLDEWSRYSLPDRPPLFCVTHRKTTTARFRLKKQTYNFSTR